MAEPVSTDVLRAKPPAGAVDPDVKIPRAVLEQGKRAEEIQRLVTGQAEPSVLPAADPATPEVPPSPVPQTPPAEEPQPEPEPQPQPGEPDNLERRFKGLQSRYDRDVKQVRLHIDQMSNQIQQLQRENQTLRAVAPPPASTPASPQMSLLSEQEIQDYGPEFIDVVRRLVREERAPLEAEIHNLRGQLGYVQQETGQSFLNRMDETLMATVGKNWRELNVNPRFVEWTKLPDVFSGAIRQQLMQEAWNAGDAHRVAAFFRAFLAEEAAVDPQRANGQLRPASRMQVTPTSSPVPPPPAAPQLTLESLAAPGRAHSAAAPAEKPVYTSADITRFYTDVKLGRYRGHEQTQAAIDADIVLAGREGRIITDSRLAPPAAPSGYAR